MNRMTYLANVATLELDVARCTGCGTCTDVCPHGVLAVEDRKAHIIDRDACMECGACARNCPADALSVQAGVGCAAAVLTGALRRTEPNCDCSSGGGNCCDG